MASGTLRAVSELMFGEQTEYGVRMARGWLRERSHWTTRRLTKFLSGVVHPRILVDKSPAVVYLPEALDRMYRMFPNGRFIHLLRHPRGHGESVMKLKRELEHRAGSPLPRHDWVIQLCLFAPLSENDTDEREILDPQRGWYILNKNICKFLESVPASQKTAIRGEDLLENPDTCLRQLANWMGLRTDHQAIEAMKHPERSPYIGFGPEEALKGNDPFFLANPVLRPGPSVPLSLEGPLSWRSDGAGFLPEVKRLAQRFGYT